MNENEQRIEERRAEVLARLVAARQACAHEELKERTDAIGRVIQTCKCGKYTVKPAP